ncbi:MAG: hypothetical protein FWF55_02325 [Treponema sp.]|nr:hypothetical protein [Treponema sp.]
MKNVYKLIGFIAILAVISLALSCEQEVKPPVSLPSLLEVADAPNFTSTFPERKDVLSLFSEKDQYNRVVLPGVSNLQSAYNGATGGVFRANLSPLTPSSANRVSGKVDFKDATTTLLSGLTVNGTTSGSLQVNGLSLADYIKNEVNPSDGSAYQRFTEKGQNRVVKRSAKVTFAVPALIDIGSNMKVGGVIKAEGKRNSTVTLLDLANQEITSKGNYETKYSVVWTVDNGTNGAKFRFSYGYKSDSSSKKVSGKSFTEESNFEVYDNTNTLQYTFNASEAPYNTLSDFVVSIIDGQWDFATGLSN